MKLITKEIERKLRANQELPEKERVPHLKLFNPTGSATWLISEIESGSIESGNAIFFGLCDLGMGHPELGAVSMQDLTSFKGFLGLGIERDLHWQPTKTLSEYANAARETGHIAA